MPTLKFKQIYKSIEQFSNIELTKFSIITGLNGCGKTHLLESILRGNLILDNIDINDIKYFDFTTFFIENEMSFSDEQLAKEKIQAWELLIQNKKQHFNLLSHLASYKTQLGENFNLIKKLANDKNKTFLNLADEDFKNPELLTVYKRYKNQFNQIFNQSQTKSTQYQNLKEHALKINTTIDSLSEREFKDFYIPTTLKNEFLPSQISKIFLDYKNKEYQELVIRKAEAEHYGEEITINNEEEFQKIYGPKPWIIINEILSKFSSLNFSINNPEDLKFRSDSITRFNVQLKNERTDKKIPFSSLSSGEKVLFALVLSMYKSFDDSKFPKVLLLDEIDATLHPSMIKNLLEVIEDVFVKQNNVIVILATHSPTTIALSKEESIFIVNKENTLDKIIKQSKSKALNILTEGYISLSHGLSILDQVAKKELNVFTEGNNTEFIKKALSLFCPELNERIEVMENIADRTGKNQLPVLYDFFLRLNHENKVLFVYDCDVNITPEEKNQTYYFTLPLNENNNKFINGIENIFNEDQILDSHYNKSIKKHKNGIITTTISPDKKKICNYIIENGTKESFKGFIPLIEKIKSLLT